MTREEKIKTLQDIEKLVILKAVGGDTKTKLLLLKIRCMIKELKENTD